VDLIDRVESSLWPECRASHLVWIDGRLDLSLSDLAALPGCIIQSQDGTAVLSVPPAAAAAVPLQIISLFSSSARAAMRLQIRLGRNARLDVIHTSGGEGVMTEIVDAVLDEGAQFRIAEQLKRADEAHLFRILRSVLHRNARMSAFFDSQGALQLQRDWHVMLNEEGAEAELIGIDRLKGDSQAHTRVFVEHRAPLCRSHQHFKKVLQDRSRSSSAGTIRIAPAAHRSEASQLCQNLLLSDEAVATVKPFLEIGADDVKAHHGATFTQPSEEELFYCQSRGMTHSGAKELWLNGFCREMIDMVEIPAMKERLR
jgi:Fe-S cluster assembly protein SufD